MQFQQIGIWSSIRLVAALAVAGGIGLPSAARAQADYPNHPVRIIVPYGAGGIADVTMRLTAQKLSEKLGQQFIIDNRPGAGGVVGVKAAATATPDGYTLSMIGGGLTIAKSLMKLPYDLVEDFTPISTTAFYGLLVVTREGGELKSVGDVLNYAKAHPGKLNFGSINPGSAQHLSAELFRVMAGIDVAMVPYKTTPELVTAIMRGDIDVGFEYAAGLGSAVADKRLRAIASTGRQRAPQLADVPTVAESGLPDYEVTSWNGLAAPAATPPAIVEKLSLAVNAALAAPEVQEATAKFGMEARGSTSADLRERIKRDIAKWADVIQKVGIEKKN